jgi:hypothetical protein
MNCGSAIARGLLIATLCLGPWIAGLGAAPDGPTAPAISGMGAQPELGMPDVTRVILAVVITLGAAAGAIVLLKRWIPGTASRRTGAGVITVLARANVTPHLRAHVVEVDTNRVLIVEGRSGVGLTLLPKSGSGDKPASP